MKSRIDNIKELADNQIFLFNDFLSADACNELLFEIEDEFWEQSRVVTVDQERTYAEGYSKGRTSKTIFEYFFSPRLQELTHKIQEKIVQSIQLEAGRMEEWQITKYGYQEEFEYHIDGGFLKNDPAGERVKTILLYLMSPEKGGETYFRALNLYVRPIQGRLVVWDNLLPDGNCNYAMMHAGLPVKKGIKVILNTWSRQFVTLKNINHERTGISHPGNHYEVW